MKKELTPKGVEYVDFTDSHKEECTLRKCYLPDNEDKIGIALGIKDPKVYIFNKDTWEWDDHPIPEKVKVETQIHLTREQVKELLPYLQYFVATGNI